MSLKKKVLFFIQSGCGGAERMTIYIANCLDENKYEIIFYVIGADMGTIEPFLPVSGQRHLIKASSYRDGVLFKIMSVLKKEKAAFAFSSVFPINARLCVASALFPKTRIIIRSDNYLYTQSIIQKTRLFIAYRFLDRLVAQTDEMKDEHIRIMLLKESKISTLPNPVDTSIINRKLTGGVSPFDPTKTNYVFVGRIAYVKGIDMLIKAFAKVWALNRDARLYIIGDITGMYQEYYESLLNIVRNFDIGDKVFFEGFSNNPYVYMKYATCFVLSSRNEGLPNVVLEALYLGTPVAVVNCIPVIKRIVREGVNGFVSELDDIEGLSDAMVNAANLGRVTSYYNGATKKDFQNLFL